MARRIQARAGEEAGAWGVDQSARTLVDLLTELLSAVKQSLLTHTMEGRDEGAELVQTSTEWYYQDITGLLKLITETLLLTSLV